MSITYLEAAMAFFGFASIVIGSLADYLADRVLREERSVASPTRANLRGWRKHEVRP